MPATFSNFHYLYPVPRLSLRQIMMLELVSPIGDFQHWELNRSVSMKLASAFMLCREQSGEPSFDATHDN